MAGNSMTKAGDLIHEFPALQAVKKLAAEAKSRAGAYDDAKATYQLPLWPENEVRAIPNHIARSSLFAPIGKKSGPRKRHNRAEIASRSDVSIRYSGPQLDMADCDVFMQALQIAKGAPLGEKVYFLRSELLAALKKSDAGAWYEWLHSSIERLTEGTLFIKTKRYVVGDPEDGDQESSTEKPVRMRPRRSGLHLIAGFDFDEDKQAYWLIFDPRVLAMFQNNEFALVDWEARLRIEKRVDMAKWLQNYVSTHEPGVHRISIENLKKWCGYTSPLNKFKDALEAAMRELERVGIISNAKIHANGTVSWVRLRQSL